MANANDDMNAKDLDGAVNEASTGSNPPASPPANVDATPGPVPSTFNLLDLIDRPKVTVVPEIIRIGNDDTAVILFTPTTDTIRIHFCEEPEIRGYVSCSGAACLLCRAGKRPEDRYLIPAVVPVERRVGLLMVSTSMRPGAILYQLLPHMKQSAAGLREVLFIRRNGTVFTVGSRALGPDDDDAASEVRQFMAEFSAGRINLKDAVQTLSEDQIRAVPSIQKMLSLKGLAE